MTGSGLPAARVVAWDHRARVCADGSVVLGGAPWSVLRIAEAGRPFLHRLRAAGTPGLLPSPGVERTLAEHLVARGVTHPVITPRPDAADPAVTGNVEVVVPAYDDPESLEACLTAASGLPWGPGDRGRRRLAHRRGRRRGRSPRCNPAAAQRESRSGRGPQHRPARGARTAGGVRRRGLRGDPGLAGDPVSALRGPPGGGGRPADHPGNRKPSAAGRFEAVHSELDMGPRPQLVTHGGRLGYLPSAALLVRREALPADPFDERLRVGEDASTWSGG